MVVQRYVLFIIVGDHKEKKVQTVAGVSTYLQSDAGDKRHQRGWASTGSKEEN